MNSDPTIYLAGFIEDSIVDGPGLRSVVFTQGCDKDCPGCHNPDARPTRGGEPYSPEGLYEKIASNPLCAGVTFSGGEPLLQAEALLPLARLIRGAGLSLAIYSGDTIERIAERGDGPQMELLSLADVLIDGPFVEAEKSLSLPFRGSRNQRILDSARSVSEGRAVPCENAAWFPKNRR
ncbi:MAG: radical SAM protein [Clostridiales Family XIII bacterium]|jgi:anaerobic ribonucleoside-triphosphate reductase activating protein|nr:radical SAM protein [Clostridiales Family XIII bacterium]